MFKTKASVIFTLMAVSIALCVALLFMQSWWLLVIPLVGLLIAMFALMSSYKPETPPPIQKKGKMFRSNLLQADFHQKPCKIILYEDEVVVMAKGIPDIHIAMERINTVMFEDKSRPEMSSAGFGIDYEGRGPTRLMFFETGALSAYRVSKIVDAIRTAHREWFAGCNVDPLEFIDVSALKKQAATSVFHKVS